MDVPVLIELLFIVGVGLATGSFVTALIYRLPLGLPFSHDPVTGVPVRSICPPCGRILSGKELIPFFSWLVQRGRCSCQKTHIPIIYPLTELSVLFLTILLWQIQGAGLMEAPRYILLPFAVATCFLVLSGKGWPRRIDFILLVGTFLISIINFFFQHIGFASFFIFFCATTLLIHGTRAPFEIQHNILKMSSPLLLGSLIFL